MRLVARRQDVCPTGSDFLKKENLSMIEKLTIQPLPDDDVTRLAAAFPHALQLIVIGGGDNIAVIGENAMIRRQTQLGAKPCDLTEEPAAER
jgi:hypothetical protein